MEKDQISFDSQLTELRNALLQMAEEFRIELRVVINAGCASGKRIVSRLVFVVDVALREDTHPHLIERSSSERRKRLLFQLIALVSPGIAGRAHRHVRQTVRVAEMKSVGYLNRTVIAGRRRHAPKAPLLAC